MDLARGGEESAVGNAASNSCLKRILESGQDAVSGVCAIALYSWAEATAVLNSRPINGVKYHVLNGQKWHIDQPTNNTPFQRNDWRDMLCPSDRWVTCCLPNREAAGDIVQGGCGYVEWYKDTHRTEGMNSLMVIKPGAFSY